MAGSIHERIRPARRPDGEWDEPSYGLAADRFAMRHPWGNHTHPDLELNLLLDGEVEYLHAGRPLRIAAGRLVGLWAGLPHGVVRVVRPADFCWLTVPASRLLTWGVSGRSLARLLAGEAVGDDGDPELDRRMVPRLAAELQRSAGPAREVAALELQARVLRLLGTGGSDAGTAAGPVHRLIEWLGASYREPVSLADAAAAAGLHPRRAMALFRRATGTTIHAWLTGLRLAHAARLLATTAQDAGAIGYAAGFGSRSRFYAAFTAAHGCSPESWRRRFAR
jgi:AraC-like DNA-binding protein